MEQRTASESRFYQLSFANKLKWISFVIILSLSMSLYSQNRNALYDSTTCAILPDEDLIKFPSGFFPTLPTIPSPIYKFQNTTGGIPPNDALTIFSEGTIATNHGLIGGFGLFGNATDNKWNALGVRIPATTLPYQSSTGLRSTWGQGGLNVGMGLPYSVLLTSNLNRRDALISWQDATVNGSINAQNRLVFGIRDITTTGFEEVAQIVGNGTGNFGIGLVDTSAPQIPDERLHLYDQSSLGLDLYQKWSNITNLNGARIGFESGNTSFQIRNDDTSSIEFWTNGNQQMTLDNVGFLGIGNALLPDERLHLFEQVGGQRNYLKFTTGSATSGALIGQPLGSNVFEIRQDELDDMQFWSNGTLVAHINDQFGAGIPFFGVGRSTQIGLLQVNSAIGIPGFSLGAPIVFASEGSGEFNGDVIALGDFWNPSDENLKESFSNLESEWKKILNISSYSYRFKSSDEFNFPKTKSYGFKAQEIKQYIPELVTHNGKFHLVNYNGFIPFLTQGIQEHEIRIEALEQNLSKEKDAEIERLRNENNELKNRMANIEEQFSKIWNMPCFQNEAENIINSTINRGILEDAPLLEQNEPNPFNQTTVIRYYIPESAQRNNIVVKNMEGKTVGDFNITEKGHGSIQINSGLLSAGSFYYSLIIDGSVIDTKKMILTK
jgi:hypothetical protein